MTNFFYGIFTDSQFYVDISRISNPLLLKIINFNKKYIKINKIAFDFNKNHKYRAFAEDHLMTGGKYEKLIF